MKKLVLLACVAGVLFTACTKREVAASNGEGVSLFNFDVPNIAVKQVASAQLVLGNGNGISKQAGTDYAVKSFNGGTSSVFDSNVSSDNTVVFLKTAPLSAPDAGLAVLIPFKESVSDVASLSLTMEARLGTAMGEEEEGNTNGEILGVLTTLTKVSEISSDVIGSFYPFAPQAGTISPDQPIGYTPLLRKNVKGLLLVLGKVVKKNGMNTRSATAQSGSNFAAGNFILLTITVQLGNRITRKHIHLSTR